MSDSTHQFRSAIVFAEVHSENLGDPLINFCITRLLGEAGVASVMSVDIAGSAGPQGGGGAPHSSVEKRGRDLVKKLGIARPLRVAIEIVKMIKRRKRYRDTIRSSDLVIFGGGQLIKSDNWNFILNLVQICWLSNRHNKPMVVYACGMSSRWAFPVRTLLNLSAKHMSHVSFRDSASAQRFFDLTGRSARVFVDPAFASAKYAGYSGGHSGRVGIGIQDASYISSHINISRECYIEIIKELISEVINRGYVPILFTNGNRLDQDFAEQIHRIIVPTFPNVEVAERQWEVTGFLSVLSNFDALIASRLHAMIAASSLGIPFAGLEWDPKVGHIWNDLGQRDAVFKFDSRDVKEAVAYALARIGETDRGAYAGRVEAEFHQMMEEVRILRKR